MLFNSYIFILFFLPLTLALYFFLNHIHREHRAKLMLIALSLWFYAYFRTEYLLVILLSVLANYGISGALNRIKKESFRKAVLAAGIAGNAGAIFYFKYFDFFLENMNGFFHTSFSMKNILMPLGISFFTFQQISYLVDSYRGETAGYTLTDYALFVTFFPQLIAGPIVTHDEMMPQFQDPGRRKFCQEYFARGIYRFSTGLSKKVLLADTLGKAAEWGFANPVALSGADTLVLSLIYTFQLYFDFSGYCDMACGIANMFHFDLPINFNSPYKAVTIADFWNRWHMTLTRFLRKYVYFPLGGNRKGKVRTLWNIIIVFLVSGIWHGADWTFILWGGVHGAAQVLYRIFGKIWNRIPRILQWLGTFLFLNMSWLIFRADSLGDFRILFKNLFPWKPGGLSGELTGFFDVIEFTYPAEHIPWLAEVFSHIPGLSMWIVLGAAFFIAVWGKNCYEREFVPSGGNAVKSIFLLVWSVLSLSGLSVFLYFNF